MIRLGYVEFLVTLNLWHHREQIVLEGLGNGILLNSLEIRLMERNHSIRKKIESAALLNWKATECVNNEEYERAIYHFIQMEETSKVFFNIASLYRKLENQEMSIEYYKKALLKDPCFAICFYMLGLTLQEKSSFKDAIKSYEFCRITMRDHEVIEYIQLGLDATLGICDILRNQTECRTLLSIEYGSIVVERKNPFKFQNDLLMFKLKRNRPFYNNVFQGHLGTKVIAQCSKSNKKHLFKVKLLVNSTNK